MAKKISELPAASTLTGTEQVPIVQSGVTKRTTVSASGAEGHPDLAAHDSLGLATDAEVTTAVDGHDTSSTAHDGTLEPLVTSLWIPANGFTPNGGSPPLVSTLGGGRWNGFLFDAANIEVIAANLTIPSGWTTFHADIWWTNAGAGTGDVAWRTDRVFRADGQSLATGEVASQPAAPTAPLQDVIEVSRNIIGATITASSVLNVRLRRVGSDAADTLGNDAGFIGLALVRAS